ncbi:unnamed protein product, partial [Mesorhabditis spiculigera]
MVGDDNKREALNISIRNWECGLQLQLVGLRSASLKKRYQARMEIKGCAAQCAMINRVTAGILPHQVSFSYEEAELGGGPARDGLNVLRGPFSLYQNATVSQLRDERMLARQPNIYYLSFRDCPAVSEPCHSVMFEQSEYRLPEKMVKYLDSKLGLNDLATIYRSDVGCFRSDETCFIAFLGQNYAGRDVEFRALQQRLEPRGADSWQQSPIPTYQVSERLQGGTAQFALLNRLTEGMLRHQVPFYYDEHELGGGPARDALDILGGLFTVSRRCGGFEDTAALLREERFLRRQPNIIAHIPIICLSMHYSTPEYWETASEMMTAFFDAALVTHRPAGDAGRCLKIRLVFGPTAEPQTEYRLPENLVKYLDSKLGLNDVATIYRSNVGCFRVGETCVIAFLGQNYAGRDVEFRALQKRLEHRSADSWQQKWPKEAEAQNVKETGKQSNHEGA